MLQFITYGAVSGNISLFEQISDDHYIYQIGESGTGLISKENLQWLLDIHTISFLSAEVV
jgi:hypothetical protein